MKKRIFISILSVCLFVFGVTFIRFNQQKVFAQAPSGQTDLIEATVTKVLEDDQIIPVGATVLQPYQKLELTITSGSQKGKKIIVENGSAPQANVQRYVLGDRLVLNHSNDLQGKDEYLIADYVRRGPLLLAFILFIFVAVAIGAKRGFMSLIGMGVSFGIIFLYTLPTIAHGGDPVTATIVSSLFIVPVTFYLSHGFNRKTTVAIAGTFLSLILTGILANYFVSLARLNGYGSEEAGYLQAYFPGKINIQGLFLAGIIIGGVGVLNDITVSQAAIIAELRAASEKISFIELYKRAMNVGHDHIASMINTLILVYAGAAMPLLLLFIDNPQPFSQIINYEFMAEEVVRTLVVSIGLILAVPITTLLAAFVFSIRKKS